MPYEGSNAGTKMEFSGPICKRMLEWKEAGGRSALLIERARRIGKPCALRKKAWEKENL